MRAPLDSSKDSSNNSVTGREPDTTFGHLFSDDQSYQLFIHMLINFGIRKLPEGLIDGLDPSMQTEINEIIGKINEYYKFSPARHGLILGLFRGENTHSSLARCYSSLKFLREKAGANIPDQPPTFDSFRKLIEAGAKPSDELPNFPSLFELTAEQVKKNSLMMDKEVVPTDAIEKAKKDPFESKYRLSAYSDSFRAKHTDSFNARPAETVESYLILLMNSMKDINKDTKYKLENADGLRLFDIASRFGTVPILEAFVARGVDPTAINTRQETALVHAAANEGLDCLVYLLSFQEIDSTASNVRGQTCLHLAAGKKDSIKRVEILFKHLKAKQTEPEAILKFVNQQDERGKTALQHAVEKEGEGMVTTLMRDFHANPFLLDNQNESPVPSYVASRKDIEFAPEIQSLFDQDHHIKSGVMFGLLHEQRLKVGAVVSTVSTFSLGFSIFLVARSGQLELLRVVAPAAGLSLASMCVFVALAMYKQQKLRIVEKKSRELFGRVSADTKAETASQEVDLESQLEDEDPSGWDDQDEEGPSNWNAEEEEEESTSLLVNRF